MKENEYFILTVVASIIFPFFLTNDVLEFILSAIATFLTMGFIGLYVQYMRRKDKEERILFNKIYDEELEEKHRRKSKKAGYEEMSKVKNKIEELQNEIEEIKKLKKDIKLQNQIYKLEKELKELKK